MYGFQWRDTAPDFKIVHDGPNGQPTLRGGWGKSNVLDMTTYMFTSMDHPSTKSSLAPLPDPGDDSTVPENRDEEDPERPQRSR